MVVGTDEIQASRPLGLMTILPPGSLPASRSAISLAAQR